MAAAAAARGACNAVLVKPNQAGTVTDAHARARRRASARGWGTIVSARSGETEDVSIAHLAVGWDAGQLKVGSFARSERMAKWNEVLRIEEAEGANARFAGRAALPQFGAVNLTAVNVRSTVRAPNLRRRLEAFRETSMPSDIEIAQAAKLQRIAKVALERLGIEEEHLEPYGHYKAKVSLKYLDSLKGRSPTAS